MGLLLHGCEKMYIRNLVAVHPELDWDWLVRPLLWRWISDVVYSTDENIPSRDLNQWKGALSEHEQLLKRWEKAWVGPRSEGVQDFYKNCVCLTCLMCTRILPSTYVWLLVKDDLKLLCN